MMLSHYSMTNNIFESFNFSLIVITIVFKLNLKFKTAWLLKNEFDVNSVTLTLIILLKYLFY